MSMTEFSPIQQFSNVKMFPKRFRGFLTLKIDFENQGDDTF